MSGTGGLLRTTKGTWQNGQLKNGSTTQGFAPRCQSFIELKGASFTFNILSVLF